MTAITLSQLTKSYSAETAASTKAAISTVSAAVDRINLTVADGELLALLGPSGSGKTTILRLIAGLLKPSGGDILFDGQSMRGVPPEKRGAVMVFQEHSLFPFMSVGDNVAFGLRMQKLDAATIARRVQEGLDAVQLGEFASRWPDQLSGGQRQRVALARALVIRPKVLLLDEPFSNLDQNLRGDMRRLIRRLQRQYQITTVFVTHDQQEAVTIADRIALLFDGQLRQVGTPQAFFGSPKDAQVARFFGGVNFIRGVKTGTQVTTNLGILTIASSQVPDGNVLLTIRPESIELGRHEVNNVTVDVLAVERHGATVAHTLSKNLTLITRPNTLQTSGSTITIHLPSDQIWTLPNQQKTATLD